jgi:hypothetical protein
MKTETVLLLLAIWWLASKNTSQPMLPAQPKG